MLSWQDKPFRWFHGCNVLNCDFQFTRLKTASEVNAIMKWFFFLHPLCVCLEWGVQLIKASCIFQCVGAYWKGRYAHTSAAERATCLYMHKWRLARTHFIHHLTTTFFPLHTHHFLSRSVISFSLSLPLPHYSRLLANGRGFEGKHMSAETHASPDCQQWTLARWRCFSFWYTQLLADGGSLPSCILPVLVKGVWKGKHLWIRPTHQLASSLAVEHPFCFTPLPTIPVEVMGNEWDSIWNAGSNFTCTDFASPFSGVGS